MAHLLPTWGTMRRGNRDKKRQTQAANDTGPGKSTVVVKGIILPANWDPDGNTTAVAVSTYNESEYRITQDEKSSELLVFLRQEVEIIGEIEEIHNKKYITVKDYSPTSSGE